MRRFGILVVLLSVVISTSSCGLNTAESGFGGAVLGAGTGALIGSFMKNGNVGKFAAIGGLIGFPVGIALNLAADSYNRSHVGNPVDHSSEIRSNQDEIFRNNLELEQRRHEAAEDSPVGNPAPEDRGRVYDGPTLGNYYR